MCAPNASICHDCGTVQTPGNGHWDSVECVLRSQQLHMHVDDYTRGDVQQSTILTKGDRDPV